jgi:hypothetical protein
LFLRVLKVSNMAIVDFFTGTQAPSTRLIFTAVC